jgi:hypothetical protein
MIKFSVNLKKVKDVSEFIKKSKDFPTILSFLGFLRIFYIGKNHGSGLWITAPDPW